MQKSTTVEPNPDLTQIHLFVKYIIWFFLKKAKKQHFVRFNSNYNFSMSIIRGFKATILDFKIVMK